MATKEEVLSLIKALPKNTTIDDIMEELYFKVQVDEGLNQLDNNKGIPHSSVKNRIRKWIKR
jgi:hypothetical protein